MQIKSNDSGRRSSRPVQMGSNPRADRFDSCWRMAQNRALKGERRWRDEHNQDMNIIHATLWMMEYT